MIEVLGNHARVMILKTLCATEHAVSLREIMYRGELANLSTQHALKFLEQKGLISREVEGQRHWFRLHREHPMATTLIAMFEAMTREQQRQASHMLGSRPAFVLQTQARLQRMIYTARRSQGTSVP